MPFPGEGFNPAAGEECFGFSPEGGAARREVEETAALSVANPAAESCPAIPKGAAPRLEASPADGDGAASRAAADLPSVASPRGARPGSGAKAGSSSAFWLRFGWRLAPADLAAPSGSDASANAVICECQLDRKLPADATEELRLGTSAIPPHTPALPKNFGAPSPCAGCACPLLPDSTPAAPLMEGKKAARVPPAARAG